MGNLFLEEEADLYINPKDVKKYEAFNLIYKLMKKIPEFPKKWKPTRT